MWGLVLALLMQGGSGWMVKSIPDAMTDKVEMEASIKTAEGELAVLCTTGGRDVLVVVTPKAFLGGRLRNYELRDTFIRFDENPAAMESWKYHGEYAVPYSSKDHMRVARQLTLGKVARFRLRDYRGMDHDLSFDLAGAGDAIAEIATRCGVRL